MSYTPPIDDIRFTLFDVLDASAIWGACPSLAALDQDTVMDVITAAGEFARDVLLPTNADGDQIGAQWKDGTVTVPPSFKKAYNAFIESGWPALPCDEAWGGQGLPPSVNAALYEMLMATNHAWSMYPGLAHGAYECIEAYGSDTIKKKFLDKIVSGEWLATMCLTEPNAGTDLGQLRSTAMPAGNDEYRISGNKIFISGGDHDLTPNILHLVLAKLPGAPAGPKGISLFLVPKLLDDGAPNGVRCNGIEHKMGIHGSATCQMAFDNSLGWLIGEPNQGLRAMFVMMNAARLHVGLQGLGHMERSYQLSLAYAKERVQGGRVIIEHPVVQRLLLTQRAWLEGSRMLAYWTALSIDRAQYSDDQDVCDKSAKRAAVLTPIVKAMLTDRGFQNASLALQVLGGYGFTRDMQIEQHVRDVRIAMIYEGTNEIQAIDLLQRKVLADGGDGMRGVLEAIRASDSLPAETNQLISITRDVLTAAGIDAAVLQRAAVDYLHATGLLLIAALWKHAAAKALGTPMAMQKAATAGFYFDMIFPEFHARIESVRRAIRPQSDWGTALR